MAAEFGFPARALGYHRTVRALSLLRVKADRVFVIAGGWTQRTCNTACELGKKVCLESTREHLRGFSTT